MKRSGVAALRAMPTPAAALVRQLIRVADERDAAVYLVGGPVRDWLLGGAIRDLDLVLDDDTEGAAEAIARAAAPEGAQLTVHDRFGTVSIDASTASLDIATSRRESYAHDGALPTVVPGPLEADLARRDFTVNAMAVPLSRPARTRHKGIVAVAGAEADLAARRLRILHARSFHDDPTRALRAARLAPRLGFSVTRNTGVALRDALRDGAFGRVSGDRLRRELVKLFGDAALGLDPSRALKHLDAWHVLAALEPGLTLPSDATLPLRRVGRAVATPPWPAARWRPWVTGFSLWLAPLAPGLRRRALRRFGVRGALSERIADWPRVREPRLRSLAAARGRGAVDAALRSLSEEELAAIYAVAAPAIRRRVVRYAREDRHRKLPVTGADLTALGLEGPAVGRTLEAVRVAFLDGRVQDRDAALVLARELARRRSARTSRS
jgi:tRNA nucleotidyltransferase (CCA-adding enzyme)